MLARIFRLRHELQLESMTPRDIKYFTRQRASRRGPRRVVKEDAEGVAPLAKYRVRFRRCATAANVAMGQRQILVISPRSTSLA
jgi:hypothetical protein